MKLAKILITTISVGCVAAIVAVCAICKSKKK